MLQTDCIEISRTFAIFIRYYALVGIYQSVRVAGCLVNYYAVPAQHEFHAL